MPGRGFPFGHPVALLLPAKRWLTMAYRHAAEHVRAVWLPFGFVSNSRPHAAQVCCITRNITSCGVVR
jgi:hypothetical protein